MFICNLKYINNFLNRIFSLFFFAFLCVSCERSREELASWNEGEIKTKIQRFIQEITDPNNPKFVPVSKRIAVFDNDGTLWVEKPFLIQLHFLIDSLRLRLQPEETNFFTLPKEDLWKQLLEFQGRQTLQEIEEQAPIWIHKTKHPIYEVLYKDLIYQPMLELIAYLQKNGFKVWIVTGGGTDFLRMISQELFNIPPEYVVGSFLKYQFKETDTSGTLQRLPEMATLNEGKEKPVNIHYHIGQRPIFAVGNSDGDVEMLLYSQNPKISSMQLILVHDDDIREFRYSEGNEKLIKKSEELGWGKISMKNDFKKVFK